MARICDLNVQQLKRELEARHLVTKGNKTKLQTRLQKAMEAEGENGDNHVFPEVVSKTENELPSGEIQSSMEMVALLNAIAGVQDSLIQNTTQVEGMQQRIEDNLVKSSSQLKERLSDNATQLEERIHQTALELEERAFADLAKLGESLTVHLKKLEDRIKGVEEFGVQLRERQDNLEREWQSKYPEIKSKIQVINRNVEKEKDAKNDCKCEILDNNPPKIADTLRFSSPIFDGTMPFSIFKLQFEMSVKLYKWNREERLAALILALKGSATSIIQKFTNITNLDYETVMAALEKQFNGEHWQQIQNMQLVSRAQNRNETILGYANEIDRLTSMAYANSSNDFLELIKIQNFIRGLHDCDIKLAMYKSPKPTFIETLAYAITQEAAMHLAKA